MTQILDLLQQGRYYRAYGLGKYEFIVEDYKLDIKLYNEVVQRDPIVGRCNVKEEVRIMTELCVDILDDGTYVKSIPKPVAFRWLRDKFIPYLNDIRLKVYAKLLISNPRIIEVILLSNNPGYIPTEELSLYLRSNCENKVTTIESYIRSIDSFESLPLQHTYDKCWDKGSNLINLLLVQYLLLNDNDHVQAVEDIIPSLPKCEFTDILLAMWYLTHDKQKHIVPSLELLYKYRFTNAKYENLSLFGVKTCFIKYYLQYCHEISFPKEEIQMLVNVVDDIEFKEAYYKKGLLPSYQKLTIANNTQFELNYIVRVDRKQKDKFSLKSGDRRIYTELRERQIYHVSIDIYQNKHPLILCPHVDINSYVSIYGDMKFAIYYESDASPESKEINDFMIKEVSDVLMSEYHKLKEQYRGLTIESFLKMLGCDEVGTTEYTSVFSRKLNTLMRPEQLRSCIDSILGND